MAASSSNGNSSSRDIAISARGVSKCYRIAHLQGGGSSLRETLMQRLSRPANRASNEIFWALDDVSFEVRRGDVLGIIGRNGAGKSTLLKILSQIVDPTRGQIDIYGRVGSLLEVGTGFHPELTGRENIFLNGSLLGMKKGEIERQFDAIVDFAEVERFLDTPVKRYSSGMYVRLAFAIAAHLNPEILIVDEVLAVGDFAFQQKCLGKMQDVSSKEGRTVLFVSHNITAISTLCTSGLLLENGKLAMAGSIDDILEKYSGKTKTEDVVDLAAHPDRSENSKPVFQSMRLQDAEGQPAHSFHAQATMNIQFSLNPPCPIPEPNLNMGINNWRGDRIFQLSTLIGPDALPQVDGPCTVDVRFALPALMPGLYSLDISVHDTSIELNDYIPKAAGFEILPDEYLGAVDVSNPRQMGFILVKPQWRLSAQQPAAV